MRTKKHPSDETLTLMKEYFEYRDGAIYWQKTFDGRAFNKERKAGTMTKAGYRRIVFFNKSYVTSNIVYYLHTGKWPTLSIDHINGVKDDDRIENLREISQRQNSQNRKEHRQGKLPGVQLRSRLLAKGWRAKIQINKKQIYLGYFETEQEAHQAYLAAAAQPSRFL